MNGKIEIRSIEQAEKIVTSITDRAEQEVVLYRCVDSILDEENTEIAGSADAFHNFSISCIKISTDYLTAFEIVELGLKLHPSNADLLSDAIKYGYKCGKREDCEEYIRILNSIDKTVWTWRAFSFSIDYILEYYASDAGISNMKDGENELLTLVKQYQERYPSIEDSYFSEFEIYNRLGKKEEALAVLKKAMSIVAICPKCWLRYADEMVDSGKFSEAVQPIIKLCKASSASDSVNIAYVYYLKGICQMELLNGATDANTEDIFADIQYDAKKVEQTYMSFYVSLKSDDLYGSLRKKCLTRIKELSAKTNTKCPDYIEQIIDMDKA